MQELKTSLLSAPRGSRVRLATDRHMLLASSKEARALYNQQSQVFLGVPAWHSLSLFAPLSTLEYLISFGFRERERALTDAH